MAEEDSQKSERTEERKIPPSPLPHLRLHLLLFLSFRPSAVRPTTAVVRRLLHPLPALLQPRVEQVKSWTFEGERGGWNLGGKGRELSDEEWEWE